jgi:hypothetical protein
MNENELADRFNREVDVFLSQAGRDDDPLQDLGYRQALELARSLVAVDFSPESSLRIALRQRLLGRLSAPEKVHPRKEFSMQIKHFKRRPLLAFAAVLLLALIVLALGAPGVVTAAAQQVAAFISEIDLGDFTSIHQLDPAWSAGQPQSPPPPKPEIVYQDGLWILRTSIGNFGGDPLPGRKNEVVSYPTFSQVQQNASLPLLQPTQLPAGYQFREGIVTPMDWIFLFYEGPQGDIVLAQIPVYSHASEDSVNSVVVGMITDDPIESVTLNGRAAGWVAGTGLMWEAGGISYLLGCANLDLAATTRIAESLK